MLESVLVLILCCSSLLWVWPWAEPGAAQPLEFQTITRCIWKEKLQSTDPSAFLELCARSAGWLLNCRSFVLWKYSNKCRSWWDMGHVAMGAWICRGDFGSLWQSPGPVLQRNFLVLHPDHSQAVLVLGAGWRCPAALLPSFGSWGVIRKEKRENGLFLPKPFTSFREKQTDKHKIIMETKTNTQNIGYWVKCFSWASGLGFALLFHLGEISTLWESASQSLLHKRYSETCVMYSCLFKKMGHFHTNVIFLCRKYAEFIPHLLVKAIPLLVLWFQHICLTGDNQKRRRKKYYFWVNSHRPKHSRAVSLGHTQEYHPLMANFSFEQREPQSSESSALLRVWRDSGKEVFLMALLKRMPGCPRPQGCSRFHTGTHRLEAAGDWWALQISRHSAAIPPRRMNFILNQPELLERNNEPTPPLERWIFHLGKERWILGSELQTKCTLDMDNNQRNTMTQSLQVPAVNPQSSLLPAQQRCWDVWYLLLQLLQQPLEFTEIIQVNLPSVSARVSWPQAAKFLGCFALSEAFFTHGSVKKSLLWGGLWWQKCPQGPWTGCSFTGGFSGFFCTHMKAAPILVCWNI